MMGILIAYRLRTPHNPNVASALVKRLYGQNTSSQGGKYRYRRKGLLDEIPSVRLIRGVIIVEKKNKKKSICLAQTQFLPQYFLKFLESILPLQSACSQ